MALTMVDGKIPADPAQAGGHIPADPKVAFGPGGGQLSPDPSTAAAQAASVTMLP